MPITVLGPYSGQPVKIRDQDVGRAVRDEEGRIFYALPKSDGSGYYGALTRNGGPKDEALALELEAKVQQLGELASQQQAAVHDATGPGRAGRGLRRVVMLAILLLLLALAYLFTIGPYGPPALRWPAGRSAPAPTTPVIPPTHVPTPGAGIGYRISGTGCRLARGCHAYVLIGMQL